MKPLTYLVAGLTLFMCTAAESQSSLDHRASQEVNFCLDRRSDQIPAMSPNRGVCAQVGGLAIILTNAGRPDLAGRIMLMRQYEAGDAAVQLACLRNSAADVAAAALIMACQCHNISAYNFTRDNQGSINAALRARRGC
ncbi:hypothetical protein [Xanthobacter sp. VNH20]|uniref:hypothetical protein n=1 Tax=Xanthobacter sp. VNH20 TaxID=3156616 RepID=UPI0032B5D2BF